MLRSASIALLAVVLTACMESVPTDPVSFAESPRVGDSGIALQTTWTFNPQETTKKSIQTSVFVIQQSNKMYQARIMLISWSSSMLTIYL